MRALRPSLFCLLLGVAGGVAANTPADSSTLIIAAEAISIDPASGLRMYQNSPFSGEVRTFHADGQVAATDQFRDGKRHGHARN